MGTDRAFQEAGPAIEKAIALVLVVLLGLYTNTL